MNMLRRGEEDGMDTEDVTVTTYGQQEQKNRREPH